DPSAAGILDGKTTAPSGPSSRSAVPPRPRAAKAGNSQSAIGAPAARIPRPARLAGTFPFRVEPSAPEEGWQGSRRQSTKPARSDPSAAGILDGKTTAPSGPSSRSAVPPRPRAAKAGNSQSAIGAPAARIPRPARLAGTFPFRVEPSAPEEGWQGSRRQSTKPA